VRRWRAIGVATFAVLLLGGRTSSAGEPRAVQIAVLVDTDLGVVRWNRTDGTRVREFPAAWRGALESLEGAFAESGASIRWALVSCESPSRGTPGELRIDRPFSASPLPLASAVEALVLKRKHGCPADADLADQAITRLEWSEDADRRILVIGPSDSVLGSTRQSAETVMHRAVRLGIVVHALELDTPGRHRFALERRGMSYRRILGVPGSTDVRAFLSAPTLPLGRVPTTARHAVILTGGTYVWWTGPIERDRRFEDARVEDDLPERAFGPSNGGKDALDDLAEGLRRPSEVTRDELPSALHGIALEPLLDAIWDYVDARRVMHSSLEQLRGRALPIERRLVDAVLGAPRRMPSRR
jgi:hypothetical protein